MPRSTPGLRLHLPPRLNFQFDMGTYKNLVAFKFVELSNGALLTADTERFDKVFQQEPVDGSKDEVKCVTKGKVIDEKFKTAR